MGGVGGLCGRTEGGVGVLRKVLSNNGILGKTIIVVRNNFLVIISVSEIINNFKFFDVDLVIRPMSPTVKEHVLSCS